MLEEAARAGAVAEHQVPADDAVRVREAVRELRRLREQQQARRLRAVRRQDDGLRPLLDFALLGVEIDDAGDASAVVDRNLAHVAVRADFAFARLLAIGSMVTAELDRARTWHPKPEHMPQLHARGAAHVRVRDDRQRARDDVNPSFLAAMLNSAPELFSGTRRHRIVLRHRRHERRIHAQPGDAHLPFGLHVVRLQLFVGDRPVRHAGAGRNRRIGRQLVELVRQMAPAAAAVGDRAAADDAAIAVGAGRGLVLVVPAERVALPRRIAHQPIFRAWLSFNHSSLV